MYRQGEADQELEAELLGAVQSGNTELVREMRAKADLLQRDTVLMQVQTSPQKLSITNQNIIICKLLIY